MDASLEQEIRKVIRGRIVRDDGGIIYVLKDGTHMSEAELIKRIHPNTKRR